MQALRHSILLVSSSYQPLALASNQFSEKQEKQEEEQWSQNE